MSITFPGGVASGAPAGAVVDSFARADSSTLGQTETGQAWTVWSGSGRVVSQQAELASSGYTLAVVDTGLTGGTAAVSVPVVSPEYWLVFRASDGANYWRFGRWQGGDYQLQQVVGNALGGPALEQLATVSPAAGDRLSCQLASTATCSVNDVAVVRTADPFNASARFAGLAAYSTGGTPVRFDDVLVEAPPAVPDLRVAVTAGSASAPTGAPVSWTATISNVGSATATSTAATVSPPAGLTGTSVSASTGTCSPGGSTWTCSLGDRAAGSSATITVGGTAPSEPASLTLSVSATSPAGDAQPADNTASATVTTSTAPPPGTATVSDTFGRADSSSLGSAETGQPWTVWSGSGRVVSQQAELSSSGYTLATVDSGLTIGTAAVGVSGPSPEYWLVVRASDGANYWRFGRWQGGTYQLQQVVGNGLGGPVVEQLDTVTPAPGDRLSCQLASTITCSVNGVAVVRTADPFNASARLAGLAAYAAGGATPARFDDVLVEAPAAVPNLRVTVTAGSASATTGAPVSWTATVVNAGSATAPAAGATVTPPAGLTGMAVSSSVGSCMPNGSTWSCSLGDRPAGSSATITVNGTAPSQPASLTLTVSATPTAGDAEPADNTASATVTTTTPPPAGSASASDTFARADSAALGSAETGQPWAMWSGSGRVVSQQAETSGAGYSVAAVDAAASAGTASVRVPTVSPEYWLVVRASSPSSYWRFGRWQGGGYQLQQVVENALGSPAVTTLGSVTPRAGDLLSCALGPDLTCSVNGTSVVATSDAFNATATWAGFAAGSGSPTRFDDFYVVRAPGPDLRVVLSGPGTVDTTTQVSWSGTVSNQGTSVATGTVVTVQPPAGLTEAQVSTSAGACTPAGGTWTCSVGNRQPGTSLTLSVSGVAPAQPGTLTLTVSASSGEADVDPGSNSASFSTTVRTPPTGGTVVLDRFNRANASTLGTAETGQTWTRWLGTARVASQQAELAAARYSVAVVDAGTATGTATVTVPTATSEFWLVFRGSDSGNYWRFGRWRSGAYELQQVVKKKVGNPALTRVATVNPGAGDRLSCEIESTITCSVNGTDVVRTADGFNATARFVGLAANGVVATRFDDLSVTSVAAVSPDLSVAATASSTAVQTGGAVSWSATVRNDGGSTATATVVTVTPPAALAGTAVTSSAGTCVNLVTTWQCSVGNRAAGSSLTVAVAGTAPDQPGTLTTSFSASAQETDADPANNSAAASVEVWAPVTSTAVVSDGFDRPDAATLGTADTGQAWVTLAGSFRIDAGAAAPGTDGANLAVLDPGFSYGTYQVTVKAGAASRAFAVVFRGRDADNSYRVGPDSSGFYRVWKVVDGSAQPLAASLRRGDLAPRDGDVIRIVNRPDDSVFVSVNGQHILDAGDLFLVGEPRVGLLASSTAVRFDSLSISPLMSSGVTTTDSFTAPDGVWGDRQTEAGTLYGWHPSYGWTISAGRAVRQGYGRAWVDTSSELANAKVQVRSGPAEAFLVFRYSENGDWFRFGHQAGGNYAVERVVGAWTSTVVAQTSVAPQAVDLVEVRQFLDGRVEGWVNGVQIVSFTDTTSQVRATGYGIEGKDAVFDDFAVTAK